MLRRVFSAGLIAGCLAGFVMFAVHVVRIDPLIAAAEVYEDAAAAQHPDHDMAAHAWEPEGWSRPAFTFLANLVIGAGFGLLLSGAFALRQAASGQGPDAREGVLWGIAGFAAFALAPAAGLPPIPPGMVVADILARQEWWLATALATAAGLALIAFARRPWGWIVAAALIVMPHLVGAPARPEGADVVPPDLVANFVAASLVGAALFWLTLGGVGGWLYAAFARGR
jgi:cobalt transporter subunit CbtA